ncbi:MAG: fructosamine kinase family protein, partial [Gammaproteobacteria bacterium]|nr:fructosamine kinase family protein [Gammaproteobacteria bacterium]
MTLLGIRARIEQLLVTKHSPPFHWQPLGQGVGGHSWRVTGADTAWFVKLAADDPQILTAEADGLRALTECRAVRVPKVTAAGDGFLVLEWLDFGGKTAQAAAQLGEQLAAQHRNLGERFGWRRNNFIGATPQFNTPSDDWVKFFREHRLGFQLRLAAENGYRGELQEQGARLMESLPAFFVGHALEPSLLHGDLWGGNWGVLTTGEPVIFDPAVYYGDREADLAMTELFGGFPPEFYSAYEAIWPLAV